MQRCGNQGEACKDAGSHVEVAGEGKDGIEKGVERGIREANGEHDEQIGGKRGDNRPRGAVFGRNRTAVFSCHE